jgi:putative addiction module component (TIGR02574 family)
MSKTLTEVTRDAAELPEAERLKLARILLDLSECDSEVSADVQEAWDQEIEKRLVELHAGKVKGVPLEEVKGRSKRAGAVRVELHAEAR